MTIRALTQRASNAYDAARLPGQLTTPSGVPVPQDLTGGTPPAANAAGSVPPDAVVTLSPDAKSFARIMAAANNVPDVRADRVALARARMARGEVGNDVQSLAAKILQSAEN
jgi:flagellar biosynthesis anti-sigma factor FlgM